MPRPIQQAGRAISFLSTSFLLAFPATSVSAQGTVIEEGSVVIGPVETRNDPIRIGAIEVGENGVVRHGVTRNAAVGLGVNSRVHGDVDTRSGGVVARTGASIDGRVESPTVPSASMQMPESAGA